VSDDSNTDGPNGGGEGTLDNRARELHRHLEATAELPIDRKANRWLGEAEAIAADVATSNLERETVLERVEKIQHLLSEVDDTGHDEADGHVDAATQCCRAILEV